MGKRRALTAVEKRRKERIKELLRETPLKNGQDLNNIIKEFIAEIVNGSLEGELDDGLEHDKYDVQNKDTDNRVFPMKMRRRSRKRLRHCLIMMHHLHVLKEVWSSKCVLVGTQLQIWSILICKGASFVKDQKALYLLSDICKCIVYRIISTK